MQVPESEIKTLTTQSVDTITEHAKLYKESDRLLVVITPGYYLEVTEHMLLLLAIASRLYKGEPPRVELWEGQQFAMKFESKGVKQLLQSSE